MGERYSGKIFPQKKSGKVLVIHFESEIDRLVYQLFGLTNEKLTVAVCYPRKTLINSLMPTTSM